LVHASQLKQREACAVSEEGGGNFFLKQKGKWWEEGKPRGVAITAELIERTAALV
jgi:hypothetical protein